MFSFVSSSFFIFAVEREGAENCRWQTAHLPLLSRCRGNRLQSLCFWPSSKQHICSAVLETDTAFAFVVFWWSSCSRSVFFFLPIDPNSVSTNPCVLPRITTLPITICYEGNKSSGWVHETSSPSSGGNVCVRSEGWTERWSEAEGSRLLPCSRAKPETLAVMRSRDNCAVPAGEAAAALPYGLLIRSLSHYNSQNKQDF